MARHKISHKDIIGDNVGAYIGIDPATKTSPAAIVCLNKHLYLIDKLVIGSGFSPSITPVSGSRWDYLLTYRIEIIRSELAYFLSRHTQVSAVCIEEPRLLGKANKNMLKLLGVIENVIYNQYLNMAPIYYVDPSTSKKWVGGHGRAEKQQVLDGVLDSTPCRQSDFIISGSVCYDLSDAVATVVASIKSGKLTT